MEPLNLNGRLVSPAHPPYVIAEIGANHNGDMQLCRRLIDAAKSAGADAVKFQSWTPSSLISKAEYQRNTTYSDTKKHFGSLEEMVEKYQLDNAMHQEAAAYCNEVGIHFMSTPFSPREVDLLHALDVPAIKVASMDINHPLLLEAIANTGRPVILSTGMSDLAEITRAINTVRKAGAEQIALLHCISIYPPAPDTIHLRNIPMLEEAFGIPIGFSDHTLGTAVPLASVAMGACIIEKHFTLDKDLPGWDHAISADPEEMAALCAQAREVHLALGDTRRSVSKAELAKRKAFRRRVVLARDVPSGHILTLDDLDFKRPGTGIHPDEYAYVVGRQVREALPADHELEWSDLK